MKSTRSHHLIFCRTWHGYGLNLNRLVLKQLVEIHSIQELHHIHNEIAKIQKIYPVLCETPSNGSSLLRMKIQRQILLILVSFPQNNLLFQWNHGQDLRNLKPNHFSISKSKNPTIKKELNFAKCVNSNWIV